MIRWLNENAPAIQALSSVIALILTGVLACLTYRYVHLTREQVRQIRDATRVIEQQSARTLQALAYRIREALGTINSESPNHMELRRFAQLTDIDIDNVAALARLVNEAAIHSGSKAIRALRTISAMIQNAKAISEGMGMSVSRQEVQDWKRSMEDASRSLLEIEAICDRAFGA